MQAKRFGGRGQSLARGTSVARLPLSRHPQDRTGARAMAMSSTTSTTFSSDAAMDTYISGLKNAHALEKQAIQLMERQVERFENYPEMSDLLRRHITETEGQIRRLDEALHSFGADRSILKDMATQFMANLAAAGH